MEKTRIIFSPFHAISRWDTLQALAAKRKDTLTNAMEKASDFNSSWREEVGWLSEAERQAYADWRPSGLPETCEVDIHKHKVSMQTGGHRVYQRPARWTSTSTR